ncbi:transposase, partial [Shigella sp. FC1655]
QSKTGLLWSRSYFVCSTGGATIETLRAYVQSQSTLD